MTEVCAYCGVVIEEDCSAVDYDGLTFCCDDCKVMYRKELEEVIWPV